MASALTMFALLLRSAAFLNAQIAQMEKDDLRPLIEADLDKGIVALRRRHYCMNAAGFADTLAMHVREVSRRGLLVKDGDRPAHQDAGTPRCTCVLGE